jgi:hypothetical protein
LVQLDTAENTGSLTLHLESGQLAPAIEIAWERPRNGALSVLARPGGTPAPVEGVVDDFVQSVLQRFNQGHLDIANRRAWLEYDGLPWKGELWLDSTLRLGPPSKFPDTLLGTQIVQVDAEVKGIGPLGCNSTFERLLRSVRLFLSVVLGPPFNQTKTEHCWVPELDAAHHTTDCRYRLVGYLETNAQPGFPSPGTSALLTRENVQRPGLGRIGIYSDDTAVRIPNDIEALWRTFGAMGADRKQQFLNACNAYHIAQSLWSTQRTACATFLVVACEALKPQGKQYDSARVYDVVASLIDSNTARTLEAAMPYPQRVRNDHVHRAHVLTDDLPAFLFSEPFRDPSFIKMLDELHTAARISIIEWLRCGGTYVLQRMPRPKVQQRRNPRQTRAPTS